MGTLVINRFDKSFGPVGSFAGLFIFLAGLILIFYSYSAIILILLGAFVGFTHSSASIDFGDSKIRLTNNICGIFKFGKWIQVHPEMVISIKSNRQIYRNFSRSNRVLDIKTHKYQVLLCDEKLNPLIPLKYIKDLDDGKKIAKEYATRLNIKTNY
ncbi:MAG: hypothetical protein JXA77_00095 [Bacteroidales bacterium]|nr:hypothetical protein [Bacteroidales bacterium]MBN2821260.1 hypothetical protein [Bacteroidales bacterium]